jgi:hypothetical protein
MLVLMAAAGIVYAATVPNTFSPNTVASSAEVNENFSYLADRSWDLNGTDLYYNGGNVGVGTTAPSYPLEVVDGVGASGHVDVLALHHPQTNTQGDGPAVLLKGSYDSAEYKFGRVMGINSGSNFGGEIRLQTKPEDGNQTGPLQTRMTIKADGDVGIGEVNPSTKLHVAGPITASGTGGNVLHSCVWRTGSASSSNEAVCNCLAGETVIAGGASCSDGNAMRKSAPEGNGWHVLYLSSCGSVTSYALCCKQ